MTASECSPGEIASDMTAIDGVICQGLSAVQLNDVSSEEPVVEYRATYPRVYDMLATLFNQEFRRGDYFQAVSLPSLNRLHRIQWSGWFQTPELILALRSKMELRLAAIGNILGPVALFEFKAPPLEIWPSLILDNIQKLVRSTDEVAKAEMRANPGLALSIRDAVFSIREYLVDIEPQFSLDLEAAADPDVPGPPVLDLVVHLPDSIPWETRMKLWDSLSKSVGNSLAPDMAQRIIVSVEPE